MCKFVDSTLRDIVMDNSHVPEVAQSLQAGRSWVRIPVEGEIFRSRPDRPCGPLSLLYNDYRLFPGGKAAGAWR
jgi:hypothetical protein